MPHGPAKKGTIVFAAGPVLVVIALKCALELAVAGRYGWHRDELYYAVAGLHLQGGYVEFVVAFMKCEWTQDWSAETRRRYSKGP